MAHDIQTSGMISLTPGTERITELFLTSSVDEAERKKIIAMYIGRIRDNLSSGSAMGDSVQMIDTVCIGAIDERITELLGMEKLNSGQCDAGAGLCERLEALIARFKEKHWKLPLLNNANTKKCAGILTELSGENTWLVGAGIYLNNSLPPSLKSTTISLKTLLGSDTSKELFLEEVLSNFWKEYAFL